MSWERVHTVNDFYDGPRMGVADFQGTPHIYQAEFSEAEDDYTGRFWLKRIEQDLFSLIMEGWAIWLRWQAAFREGKTTLETHPALPEERKRHRELIEAIGDRFHARPEHSVLKVGHFRCASSGDLQVEWTDPHQ